MKLHHLCLCVALLIGMSQDVRADGKASGSTSFNGKSLTFEISGESSVSVDASANNGVCTFTAEVGSQSYKLTADNQQLTWNGKTVKLGDYKKIEVKVDYGKVEIKVDGKVVIPKP